MHKPKNFPFFTYDKYYYCPREKTVKERWVLHEDAVKDERGMLRCPKCGGFLRLNPRTPKSYKRNKEKKPYVIEIPEGSLRTRKKQSKKR